MKKILLFTFAFSFSIVNAQLLQSDNFNSLTIGNVGTDFTGVTPGQGGWLTSAGNGAAPTTTTNSGNDNFQIVASGNTSTYGAMIQGPNGDKGGKYMWKDGLETSWASRTAGNDIIEVEVDFFTGAVTTSTAFTGVYLYNAPGYDLLNGFIYTNNTRLLRGIARLNNAGTIDTFTINLATGGLILAANTWYRLGFGYNSVTGQPTWRINTSTGTSTMAESFWAGGVNALSPSEVNLAAEGGTGNTVAYNGVFDNFQVKATSEDTLLGNETFTMDANSISVYPNPAKDVIRVSNTMDVSLNNVVLTDLNGRTVKSITVNANEAEINISDLATGIYMMNVTTDQGSVTKKIIKE